MDSNVQKIAEAVRAAGGRALLVGGSVRDLLLGIESKDFDLEVFGLEPLALRQVLESIGRVNRVGEHFAVYKLAFARAAQRGTGRAGADEGSETALRYEIDVSLPRRESKHGRGHRGFVIEGDPNMTFEEATRRRDFTINAIMLDPLTSEVIDPVGGVEDLKRRTLKAVAADTFVEDSLRVLRAVQLAARFQLAVDPQTARLCRSIDLSDLPRERIWGEVEKLLMMAEQPSTGLDAALELGVLDQLFPEIRALVGCVPASEPSAELFTRTKRRLDEAAKLVATLPKPQRIAVMLAALCQDLSKASSADPADAQAVWDAGTRLTAAILERLGLYTMAGYDLRPQVPALVAHHQKPEQWFRNPLRATNGDFRRLALQVDLNLLYRLAKADLLARAGPVEAADWFRAQVKRLHLETGAPTPLLLGRHLLEAGFQPGPEMGRLLRQVYELQLDDQVTTVEEAMAAARRLASVP